MRSVELVTILFLAPVAYAQQPTRTCFFLTGPAKGQTQTCPGGTPTAVGKPCQDGISSAGVAVPPSGPAGSFSMNGDTPVCRDVIGTPVPYKPNEGIPKSGLSTVEGNQPVIYLRNSLVASYPVPVKRFLYAHECGHHALGHVIGALYYRMVIGPPDELAADCFSGQQLLRKGLISAAEWQQVLGFVATIPGDPTTYAGPQRVQLLKQCVN
jgi:hypothetical protein